MSKGQRLVLQDGAERSIIAGPLRHKGMVRTWPLADPQRDMRCPGCAERMYPWKNCQFVRHAAGLSCRNPKALDEYMDRAFGESSRHAGLKEWTAYDYRRTGAWESRTEYVGDHCRPDVALFPVATGRTTKTVGFNRHNTAAEIQLVGITRDEIDDRTRKHRMDGFSSSLWLKAGPEPQPLSNFAHVVWLSDDDQVTGIATNVEQNWSDRYWADPMDLDKFTAAHRANRVVLHPQYGVVTLEAIHRYIEEGNTPRPKRQTSPTAAIPEHASPHDSKGEDSGPCWCPYCIARMLQTVTGPEVQRALYGRLNGVTGRRDQEVLRLIDNIRPEADWAARCRKAS